MTAVIVKIFGLKLLPHYETDADTYWLEKEEIDLSLDRMTRQG